METREQQIYKVPFLYCEIRTVSTNLFELCIDHENDECRSNSPSSVTMRQQLKDMFKHRTSRYNFLDLSNVTIDLQSTELIRKSILDNTLTGDERIGHLKDKMRDCQKVFFNLKSALVKIEKQRKVFLRKQKSLLQLTTPTTSTS